MARDYNSSNLNLSTSCTHEGCENAVSEFDVYHIVWKVVYVLIAVPTVLGNGLIIVSIVRFQRLRNTMHVLVGNLAVSDILVGAVLVPFDGLAGVYGLNSNKYVCLCKLGVFVLTLGGSCFSLLLISIERCLLIMFPLTMRGFFTPQRLTLILIFSWLFVLTIAMLPVTGWNNYFDGQIQCLSDELWSPGYELLNNWMLIGTLITNISLYAVVASVALRRAKARKLRGQMKVHSKAEREVHKMITMIIVLGVFAFCWSPYVSTVIVMTFYDTPQIRFVRRCCIVPGLFNSGINWLIYGLRNKEAKEAFKTTLQCKGKKYFIQKMYEYQHSCRNAPEVNVTTTVDNSLSRISSDQCLCTTTHI